MNEIRLPNRFEVPKYWEKKIIPGMVGMMPQLKFSFPKFLGMVGMGIGTPIHSNSWHISGTDC